MTGLTTLQDVKDWLGLSSTADDALLARLIASASRFIESWVGRTITSVTYTETFNGDGHARLVLPNYPVTAVSSVTIDGSPIPAAAPAAPNGYLFDALVLYLNGYAFARGVQNVTVVYTAGYASVPPDLAQACIELVALRYKERDRVGQGSKSVGGETITFTVAEMTESVRATLSRYRKVVPA